MKATKKYLPIALLITSLGLGFNLTSCSKEQKSEKPKREQIIKEEYDKKGVINSKEYYLGEELYTEYDNKVFTISSKVKILDSNTEEAREFFVSYQCDTNTEGVFYHDYLSISDKPDNAYQQDKMIISADRTPSGELEVALIMFFYSNGFSTYVSEEHLEKDKYFKFGKEKLELYGKLFNIEERQKQAKGKNLHHLLKEFDINNLTIENFQYDPFRNIITAVKDGLDIRIESKEDYKWVSIHVDRPDGSKDCSMNFSGFDADDKVTRVYINNTAFELEDEIYKYIKDLYTEEQVKEIIKDANEKMAFIKNIAAQIVPKEKESFDEKILKKFE